MENEQLIRNYDELGSCETALATSSKYSRILCCVILKLILLFPWSGHQHMEVFSSSHTLPPAFSFFFLLAIQYLTDVVWIPLSSANLNVNFTILFEYLCEDEKDLLKKKRTPHHCIMTFTTTWNSDYTNLIFLQYFVQFRQEINLHVDAFRSTFTANQS